MCNRFGAQVVSECYYINKTSGANGFWTLSVLLPGCTDDFHRSLISVLFRKKHSNSSKSFLIVRVLSFLVVFCSSSVPFLGGNCKKMHRVPDYIFTVLFMARTMVISVTEPRQI